MPRLPLFVALVFVSSRLAFSLLTRRQMRSRNVDVLDACQRVTAVPTASQIAVLYWLDMGERHTKGMQLACPARWFVRGWMCRNNCVQDVLMRLQRLLGQYKYLSPRGGLLRHHGYKPDNPTDAGAILAPPGSGTRKILQESMTRIRRRGFVSLAQNKKQPTYTCGDIEGLIGSSNTS